MRFGSESNGKNYMGSNYISDSSTGREVMEKGGDEKEIFLVVSENGVEDVVLKINGVRVSYEKNCPKISKSPVAGSRLAFGALDNGSQITFEPELDAADIVDMKDYGSIQIR